MSKNYSGSNNPIRENKGNSIISLPTDYVVIDTETTGLDYEYCNLIEVCAIRYSNGECVDSFSSLIKPPYYEIYDEATDAWVVEYVDEYITELTGITNEMLASAPEPAVVIPKLLAFLGDSILVGHNANFDINFIYDAALEHSATYLSNNFIDTLRIARKSFPNLSHHRLSDIATACHVKQSQAHRAEADCLVTAKCYEYMRNLILSSQSEEDFQALFKRQKVSYSDILESLTATVDEIDDSNPIFGKTVVFTGALSSMERRQAFQLVLNLGGIPQDSITKKTNYLVIGKSDFAKSVKDGKTSKMKKAESYQKKGAEISIVSENAFFDLISDYA